MDHRVDDVSGVEEVEDVVIDYCAKNDDIALEKLAYDHCRLAEFHSRKADQLYRMAEDYRSEE